MIRLRPMLLLCAVLALTVGVTSAAAGNGEKNKCKNGGWQTVYRTDGTTFKNEDKCIDYLRAGGTVTGARLVFTRDIASCGGTCWGFLTGRGLAPNAEIDFPGVTAFADSNGNFGPEGPFYSCGSNWTGIQATSVDPAGRTITSNVVNTPCG